MNPKIRYYLESKSKNVNERIRPELIMVEVSYGYRSYDNNGNRRNKPFRITLNATIEPKNFGLAEDNFKFNPKIFNKYSKYNRTIKTKMELFEVGLNKVTNDYLINKIVPKPLEFKKALKIELGQIKKDEVKEVLILDFLYKKIKNDRKVLEIEKRKGIKKATIKSYVSLSHHIENYQLATGDILTFSNFDETRYWHFWEVINDIFKDKIKVENPNQKRKQRKDPNGYSVNSLQKHQKNFLSFLRIAKKEHNLMLDISNTDLVLADAESRKDFYVDENDLKKIVETDVSFDSKLQRAKEYTIISALTGMRFESMIELHESELEICKEDNYNFYFVHSKQNKTKTEVFVPILKPVIEILKGYNFQFPKFSANQIINEDLKNLFEYAKIDDEIILKKVTFTDGTIETKLPKFKAVSTHVFKHSFYSNLYKHKVRASVIDSITHPDKAPKNPMAKIYNRANMEDKAKMFVDEIRKIDSEIYKLE